MIPTVGLFWSFGDYSVRGTLFATLLGSLAGLLWGLIMWEYFSSAYPINRQESAPNEFESEKRYAFDARYDEEGAAEAERTFYIRSIKELRTLSTVGAPFALAFLLWIYQKVSGSGWGTMFFSVMLALSIIVPVFMYFARPAAAKQLARKNAVRKIVLNDLGLEVTTADKKAIVFWSKIMRVWETSDYLLLVRSAFGAISIPRKSLPNGAEEFIRNSVKNANSLPK